LSRAHRGRIESDDSGTAGATALELREKTRSQIGELTNVVSTSDAPTRPTRPTGSSSRVPARARRAAGATKPHDGWTFVLIPPGVGARPRTLRISVRRLRFVVASFLVVFGSTALTGGLLVLALSFLPPAQDEVRGVELGVFASRPIEPAPDSGRDTVISPAAIAAASAGAAAPRTPATRPRTRRPSDDASAGNGSTASPSIIESLPVVGEITSRFARARRHPLLGVVRRHAGIDIAAPAGTHITAPAPGVVRFSGRKFGYGYTVEIDHGNGVVTRYAHCRSLMVRLGDEVAAGAVIATVGRSGLATAPHLHYEVLVRGRNVNPLRTPLASLLDGRPAPAAAPQPAVDSALRAPAPGSSSDEPAPDVPVLPVTPGDTIEDAPPLPVVVSRTPVVTGWLPGPIPMPVTAVKDSARKS
jgi:murein DD-endopeptidase MepM/ murein hydrolase activator NlpD